MILIGFDRKFWSLPMCPRTLKAKGDKKVNNQAKTNSVFVVRMALNLRTTLDQLAPNHMVLLYGETLGICTLLLNPMPVSHKKTKALTDSSASKTFLE
jgi:hypothetical protein